MDLGGIQMTEQEKKMKKYVNAIDRRLRMPLREKARVLNDLSSSIQARREVGKTDEEIYAELGTPKQAAADLNEQMREYTYRKSPWRFVFLTLAVLCGLYLLGEAAEMLLVYIITGSERASMGVIGGADGPTAVFVTTSVTVPTQEARLLAALVLLVAGAFGYWRLKRCKQKDAAQ